MEVESPMEFLRAAVCINIYALTLSSYMIGHLLRRFDIVFGVTAGATRGGKPKKRLCWS